MATPIDQTAQPFLTRIENLHADLDSKRGTYMAECRVVREDIKEVYGEAKSAGVAVKALKGLVRWRKLERDQAKIGDGLDIDESSVYARLVETLGPLGMGAASAHGYAEANGDQDDVRPRFLRDGEDDDGGGEPPREDEERLARVGRGRSAAAH